MLRSATLRTAVLVILLSITAMPAQGLDLGGHDRDGTVIGVNVGAGWTRYELNSPDYSGTTGYNSAFSGGIRMGFAFAARDHKPSLQDYAVAILLPLVGWSALIPGAVSGGAILMAGFLVSTVFDRMAAQAGTLPYWYGRYRLHLLDIYRIGHVVTRRSDITSLAVGREGNPFWVLPHEHSAYLL